MNYLAYLHTLGFTHKLLNTIFTDRENYKEFYDNLSYDLLKNYLLSDTQIYNILQNKAKFTPKVIDKKIKDLGVKLITIKSKVYPISLKNISNKPYFLYVRGELQENDNYFAVVGSRKISSYAKKAGELIIPDLTKYFTIVSGGAGGCDSLAHKITLENNGRTIVVFGTGIDVTYPVGNANLFENVIKNNGALVSIFPIGTPGGAYTFPVRNEIVSGMSKGVLVLEAGEKSGTLITVNMALDQGKDIFAIPGDIFNTSHIGTNNLIKNSQAKLITESFDILGEYNYQKILLNKNITFDNDIQENIFNILKSNISLNIDELLEKTGYDYGVLALNLTFMELGGFIKKDMLGKYGV